MAELMYLLMSIPDPMGRSRSDRCMLFTTFSVNGKDPMLLLGCAWIPFDKAKHWGRLVSPEQLYQGLASP